MVCLVTNRRFLQGVRATTCNSHRPQSRRGKAHRHQSNEG